MPIVVQIHAQIAYFWIVVLLRLIKTIGLCLRPEVWIELPTPADEIPGDFLESFEIPGVSRFLLYKRPSKNNFFISNFLLLSLI